MVQFVVLCSQIASCGGGGGRQLRAALRCLSVGWAALCRLPHTLALLTNMMMKIYPLFAALAALPLLAQEPQTPPENASCSVKCSQCGNRVASQCPQAAMAAAAGFQKGFHMGFEAGFSQAARMAKGCGGPSCRGGAEGKPHGGPHGRPAAAPQPSPMPRPEAQPQPAEGEMAS